MKDQTNIDDEINTIIDGALQNFQNVRGNQDMMEFINDVHKELRAANYYPKDDIILPWNKTKIPDYILLALLKSQNIRTDNIWMVTWDNSKRPSQLTILTAAPPCLVNAEIIVDKEDPEPCE